VPRASSGGTAAASSSAEPAVPSRAELYRTAQRLEIPGRSKMTRDELAAAVEGASVS